MKVSVVLPIYNVAKYLPKCLDSLLNQSLEDIEIICVNDCSPDNSLEILQQYAKKDSRIKIIDQANTGPGTARNNGIRAASGEYVGFVDPDDWVDKEMFAKMYQTAVENNADIVECGVMTHNEKTGKTKSKQGFASVISSKAFNAQEYPEYVFDGITSGWNKLCRRTFLIENNIYFSDGRAAEDHYFTIAARLKAKSAVCLPEPYYNYFVRSSSLTQSPSKANLDVPLFLAEIANMIGKWEGREQNSNPLPSLFAADAAGLAAIHYRRVPKENQQEYLELCEKCLPAEANRLFREFIKDYTLKDKIFSIRTTVKGIQQYKVLTVLGLKFRFKG
ncbi:MAG: glycosyltransferase [Acetobacter sp.]|nr:glycosyltransferase [Acetobacter sp.]